MILATLGGLAMKYVVPAVVAWGAKKLTGGGGGGGGGGGQQQMSEYQRTGRKERRTSSYHVKDSGLTAADYNSKFKGSWNTGSDQGWDTKAPTYDHLHSDYSNYKAPEAREHKTANANRHEVAEGEASKRLGAHKQLGVHENIEGARKGKPSNLSRADRMMLGAMTEAQRDKALAKVRREHAMKRHHEDITGILEGDRNDKDTDVPDEALGDYYSVPRLNIRQRPTYDIDPNETDIDKLENQIQRKKMLNEDWENEKNTQIAHLQQMLGLNEKKLSLKRALGQSELEDESNAMTKDQVKLFRELLSDQLSNYRKAQESDRKKKQFGMRHLVNFIRGGEGSKAPVVEQQDLKGNVLGNLANLMSNMKGV